MSYFSVRSQKDRVLPSVKSVNSAYSVAKTDEVILATGTITLTLPSLTSDDAGVSFFIKNMGTGTITVDTAGAETIDGASSQSLSSQYDPLGVIWTGSEYVLT